jgi:diguanylate cyclase (GGDEF)-like protein
VNDSERLEALREFDFLYQDQGVSIRRLCSLARQFFGASDAMITLVHEDNVRFLSAGTLEVQQRAHRDSVCLHTIAGDNILEVEDLKSDPRFRDMLDIAPPNGIRFYAGVPLALDPGVRLGAFCVVGTEPRQLDEIERKRLQYFAECVMDLMRFHRLTRRLSQSESLLKHSSNLANIGGWQYSPSTGKYEFSDNLRRLLGVEGEVDAMSLRQRIFEPYLSQVIAAREVLFREGTGYDMEVEAITPAGGRGWYRLIGNAEFRDGAMVRAFGSIQDITSTKNTEARIAHLALHDALTGLPNRELFRTRLEQAIEHGDGTGDRFALLLVDCDNFKTINDISGHDVGDAVLKSVAERIKQSLGPLDTAARLGGDEFAAILRDVPDREAAETRARAMLEVLRRPIRVGGKEHSTSVSIGLAMYPDDDTTASDLMKDSDLALYLAKANGRAQVAMFSLPLRDRFEAKAILVDEVWRGIEAGEFELQYEPVCAVDRYGNWSFVGFQALSRWRHPRLGVIRPGSFALALDETDIAVRLSEINLAALRKDLAAWRKENVPFGAVAMTISDAALRGSDICGRIEAAVGEDKLPPGMLTIGVRESVFQSSASATIAAGLAGLRERGLRIALDDFGNGHTALAFLRSFPLDGVWVDRGFIHDLGKDEMSTAIAKAVIDLGLALGLSVTVEGVEDSVQALALVRLGPILMRGPHFAAAMPASEVPALIRAHTVSDRHLRWQIAG